MNNTKWNEIFKEFYYGIECSLSPVLCSVRIPWTTKTINGFLYSDSTWTHFGSDSEEFKEIEWLRIDLTPQNREIVLNVLRKVHVPGEVFDDCVYVYGYRTDVAYL